MTKEDYTHPITPPPELVQQWRNEWIHEVPHGVDELDFLAKRGSQWGADQELEACVEWLDREGWFGESRQLRAARRPKPPTLNSIALQMLGTIERDGHYLPAITETIRRAIEQLPDHE